MLVLSRKHGERIVIGPGIEVTVVAIRGGRVQLALQVPRDIAVYRQELLEQAHPDRQAADAATVPADLSDTM